MRLLKRNCTGATYYPYTGQTSDLNEDGLHTGEYHPVYGDAVEIHRANLSTASGRTEQNSAGKDNRYTHTMLIDRKSLEIEEHGKIECKGESYEILAVRRSLSFISLALRRIQKSGERG